MEGRGEVGVGGVELKEECARLNEANRVLHFRLGEEQAKTASLKNNLQEAKQIILDLSKDSKYLKLELQKKEKKVSTLIEKLVR